MDNTTRPGRLHLRIGKYKGIGEHDEYHIHALLFGHDGQPGPFGMMNVYIYHEGMRQDFVFGESVMRKALPNDVLESIADELRKNLYPMEAFEMRALEESIGRCVRPLKPCYITWRVEYTMDYE